jgi:hypothetical protein
MGQDGLCLIVGGVGHRDSIQIVSRSRELKKLVAQAPRAILTIPAVALSFAGHIAPARFDLDMQISREGFHKLLIGVGIASAKLMVEMQYDHGDPELGAQFLENPEHRHGIGSARDTQADSVAWPDHPVASNGFKDSLVQRETHAKGPWAQLSLTDGNNSGPNFTVEKTKS